MMSLYNTHKVRTRYIISGLFAGHDPTRGSGQEVFNISRVGSGQEVVKISRVESGREMFKSRGSNQVGSRFFSISRVGPDWIAKPSNLPGRARSGLEVMKSSRVGSGHDSRETGHSRIGRA